MNTVYTANNTANTLKEYYVELHTLYNNAVNMLTALNQSLSTSASEISLTLDNGDDTSTVVRIPSFLYLEGKLEELSMNMTSLFNIPKSGEAWFTNANDMYKLELIHSNSAPAIPQITTTPYASFTDNNFLKDLVSPKMYMKVKIGNLSPALDSMRMRKIIFNSKEVYDNVKAVSDSITENENGYDKIHEALYTYTKGIDYDEYESTLQLPLKNDPYVSDFKILEVNTPVLDNEDSNALIYKVTLNTLQYHNQEDSAIEYTLKANDVICLPDANVRYKIKSVSLKDNSAIIEEMLGHIELVTYEENSQMAFALYTNDYSVFEYVEVPLEENQYICVFLAAVHNNVRSVWSAPYMVNLNEVHMHDMDGNVIRKNDKPMSYIEYYNEYCKNIGDLILGLTQAAYPQLSNYPNNILKEIQDGTQMQSIVSKTVDVTDTLKVVPINKHIIDDRTSENLINLHNQKNDINSQLQTVQANIDNVYNTLVSTDFTQSTTVTQMSLQEQLQQYYTERTTLQKQLISLVDNINSLSLDASADMQKTKYRIRGVTNTDILEEYIDGLGGEAAYTRSLDVIGLDVEYKYKSTVKDTTSMNAINSTVFTDWNRLSNIDRQRYLKFDKNSGTFAIDYIDYSGTNNIIKWNQIDIPIVQGEDVVIRVRYKFNVGQPFINIYSPWSDEMTMPFPPEYKENVEVVNVIATNANDAISAKFNNTLINEGYQEHVTNSLTVNNQRFFHMPENIYSGFNTPENNYISLKDKLQSMANDIETYKTLIDNEISQKYSVYIKYDNNEIELFERNTNNINIYNTEHISDSFVKKPMSIVIKNTGAVPIKLYSIFPGNINVPLLLDNEEFYEQYIVNYERVPLVVDDAVSYQTLGQWIYFRQKNPYTGANIYLDSIAQQESDVYTAKSGALGKMVFADSPRNYMGVDNKQALLGYRKRQAADMVTINNFWKGMLYDDEKRKVTIQTIDSINGVQESVFEKYDDRQIEFFLYDNNNNQFLVRYEDIFTSNGVTDIHIDSNTTLSEFVSQYAVKQFGGNVSSFNGAFLYPDIKGRGTILVNESSNKYGRKDYIEIPVGGSISAPITFEYYIDGTTLKSISKSLYFDIRTSLINNPEHYMLEITASYDYTASGEYINNSSMLSDEATDEF